MASSSTPDSGSVRVTPEEVEVPVLATVIVYATLPPATVEDTLAVLVTTSGPAATTPENVREALWPKPSTTEIVAEKPAAVLGVPVTAPVLGSRLSPAGRLPAVIDQVYG